jgi:hypothetical protein
MPDNNVRKTSYLIHVKVEQIKIDSTQTLDAELLPSGGQAVWLKPE